MGRNGRIASASGGSGRSLGPLAAGLALAVVCAAGCDSGSLQPSGTGTSGTTGAAGMAGAGGVAGTSSGGAGGCGPTAMCTAPSCPDGVIVAEQPCQCPVCSCAAITCPAVECEHGPPVLGAGFCCPRCPSPDIDYCQTADDCTLATSMLGCCSCPMAITKLHCEQDLCCGEEGQQPNTAPECARCGGVTCGQCPSPPTGVACIAGRCTATFTGAGSP